MDYTGFNQVMIIRMLERLIAVIVGPLAIYFGYKLFLLLPFQKDSEGKITLPGFSVILSKVGPGIFFAAFGSIIVYQSITNEVIVKTDKGDFMGGVALNTPAQDSNPKRVPGDSKNEISPQEFQIVRQAIQMLNCMQAVAVGSDPGVRGEDTEEPVRLAKMALLEKIWDAEKWGKPEVFSSNITMGIGNIHEELKEIYTGKLPGCPK
jgi:hypothetical protein